MAAHERRQAVAARNVATEVKRLKRRLEEADDELNNAAKLVIRKADRIAEVGLVNTYCSYTVTGDIVWRDC